MQLHNYAEIPGSSENLYTTQSTTSSHTHLYMILLPVVVPFSHDNSGFVHSTSQRRDHMTIW